MNTKEPASGSLNSTPSKPGGGHGPVIAGFAALALFVGVAIRILGAPAPEPAPAPAAPVSENAKQVAEKPEPAAPKQDDAPGRVRFESEPSGASLFVNGRLVGATPLTLEGLAPGAYGVRMERAGHEPLHLKMVVADKPLQFREKLAPMATGVLVVDVKPRGAEVLVDGELVGVTPLTLDKAPIGQHELLVRKTNCGPFSQRVDLHAGEKLEFKDFGLEDKVLKMLTGLVENEKQRVGHYIDLAHYYFITDDLDRSIETYMKAEDIADLPLDLPEAMDAEERALEQRLRNEDRGRLRKEIEKHKSPQYFALEKVSAFREKFERAEMDIKDRNITSWAWVEANGKDFMRNGDYVRAEQLFKAHLEKTPKSPGLIPCLQELLKSRIALRNMSGAKETLEKIMEAAGTRTDVLFAAGTALSSAKDRVRPGDRTLLLDLAQQALQKAYDNAAAEPVKAECAFEIGNVQLAGHHAETAVGWFEKSIVDKLTDEVREDRECCLAEALLESGKLDDAEARLQKLTKSERVITREKAKAALVRIKSMRE
ncbi:MAG: PEGA domain-containing protein [Planctomycetes bacterium]|nr:PEGA domain-containing protein [Planctomycetota bacterium]